MGNKIKASDSGKFDTDTKALRNRIIAHDKFGSNDLNKWIFENIDLSEGLSIIDLGCGTGKQTIPIAEVVGDTGHVFSIDLSQEALDVLSKEALKFGISERITTLCCSHDGIHHHLRGIKIDRLVSSYSLYYSKSPEKVLTTIWDMLKTGGIVFFCGPSKDNNRELKDFHYALKGLSVPLETGGAAFMERTGQDIIRQLSSRVEISSFENTLRFNSAQSLYKYWSSYNLYDESIDESFIKAAREHFQNHSFFETRKRVIGVKAIR